MSHENSNRKGIYIIFIILLIVVIGGFSYYYNVKKTVDQYSNLIYPNVYVNNTELSSLTKEDAKNILEGTYLNPLLEKNLILKTPFTNYTLNFKDLSSSYNIEETLEEAFNYGKNLSTFEKYKLIKNPSNVSMKLKFSYDPTPLDGFISHIAEETNKPGSDATLKRVKSGVFEVTPSSNTITVDNDKLKELILNNISEDTPSEISLDVPYSETTPNITTDILNKVNTKISSYTTKMDNCPSRNKNIAIATSYIDGILLMPGESFSFNGTIGNTTKDKGYEPSNVIVNNKIEQDYGGGVCQVSTTLFNAVIRSGIPATELFHHTLPSVYAPLGLDATVAYNVVDYKFTNTLPFPIFIEGYADNKSVSFAIYSDESLCSTKYDFFSQTIETIPMKTKTIKDTSLPAGKSKVEIPGTAGYRVNVYKLTLDANNNELKRELAYSHFYEPVTKIIKQNK